MQNQYRQKNVLSLFRAGQQGYIIESGGVKLGIDLYLSPSAKRNLKNFIEPEDLGDLSLLLGTHDHVDHIDRSAWSRVSAACPNVRFVAPAFYENITMNIYYLSPAREDIFVRPVIRNESLNLVNFYMKKCCVRYHIGNGFLVCQNGYGYIFCMTGAF